MLVCRICGWENPATAAFCTNCGAGLARGRAATADDNPPFRALSSPPPGAPPPETSETEDALALPKLSAPADVRRESAPTILDFRVPEQLADVPLLEPAPDADVDAEEAEPEEADHPSEEPETVDGEVEASQDDGDQDGADAAEVDDETDDGAGEDAAEAADADDPDAADAEDADPVAEGDGDDDDDEGGAKPTGAADIDAAPDPAADDDDGDGEVSPDTLNGAPLDLGAVARALRAEAGMATPAPETDAEVGRSLLPPEGSLETIDVEPEEDDEEDAFDDLRDDADADALADAIEALSTGGDELSAEPTPDPDELRPVGDDSGDLFEEDAELHELSTSDMDSLSGEGSGAAMLDTGELEALSVEEEAAGRPVPPPIPEVSARFVLRPLSENVARSQLVPIGEEPVTVGRSGADVEFGADDYLSPTHARFVVEGDALYVDDLDSLNGVWLRVRDEVQVAAGDTLLLGRQVLRLDVADDRPNGDGPDDGTQRIGTVSEGVRFRLVQLGDDGGPRDIYHLAPEGCRVGRHIADLVFTEDNFMSGTHALLRPVDGGVQLRDLSSRNGSWVRVVGRQTLTPGDAVMLGRTVWRISASVE